MSMQRKPPRLPGLTPTQIEATKAARRASAKAWRLRNPDKRREYTKAYRKRPRVRKKLADYMRQYNAKPDVKLRTQTRQRLAAYGIDQATFDAMALEQAYRCAICGDCFEETPHVDHNHTTGAVRALLCRMCNAGIGHFRDLPDVLREAAIYLERHATT